MSTRREFLIGAGAAALLGTVGLVEGCTDRSGTATPEMTIGDASSTSTPLRVGVQSGLMPTVHMRSPAGWTVSLPAVPIQGVVYCLHGYGEDHRFAFEQIHVPELVAGSGLALAVAGVDRGRDSYWHPRTDGSDALATLLDEFIPMVDRQLSAPAPRALMGWSMGGYGALLAAETAPERFKAVAVASPALWTSPDVTAPGAFDSPADYQRFDVYTRVSQLTALTVRVDCGTSDPFYTATKRFVERLPPTHQGSFGPGSHNAQYWRSVAPAQLATVASALQSG
jgi:enterochelin esterase-like enzyme